jgi:hypothetical protein
MFDTSHANARIRALARQHHTQLVWLDKALHIRPGTLSAIRRGNPHVLIVGYSPDDMAQRVNTSRHFGATIHLYDAYFTTKSYGVSELQSMGCPRAFFVGNAYDPESHRPIDLTDRERQTYGAAVAFIGTYEQQRATSVVRLCQAGIPVRVWGDGWGRLRGYVRDLRIEGRGVYGREYGLF